MNINTEDFEREVQSIRQERQNQKDTTAFDSVLNADEAMQMGLLRPEEEVKTSHQVNNEITVDANGIERTPEGEKQYQKLSVVDTYKDAYRAFGVEASHFFVPKSKELQYESKTRFGENIKYIYRYGAGTAAFLASCFYGGGELAALSKFPALAKIGTGIQKIFGGANLASEIAWGLKAARAGKSAKAAIVQAKAVNGAVGGLASGALADYILYRPEDNEGHFADAFGETDNKVLDYLQTKESDSESTAKLKNVVDGIVIGASMGTAFEFTARPLLTRFFKSQKNALNASTRETALQALKEIEKSKIDLDRFTNTADRVEVVKNLKKQAEESGEELSQLIIDNIPSEYRVEAQAIGKTLDKGEDIFVHADGTWDISVNKWDDAYKVSPDEYKKQLLAQDQYKADTSLNEVRAGDTALSHQDRAVKHTWTNRGWIGEDKSDLVDRTGSVSSTVANKIIKNYQDKFGINNNIKVEVIDGLTIKGKKVSGHTTIAKTKGKTGKNTVDKNITIKIDKNAKNPYATLRSEIEHAYDMANGTVPKDADKIGSGSHFSRYQGDNEAEVAPGYVYKKSLGKAKALSEAEEINSIQARNQKVIDEGYAFIETPIDGHGSRINLLSPEGQPIGFAEIEVKGDTIHIEQLSNTTKRKVDWQSQQPLPKEDGAVPSTPNVAEKLMDNIISLYPDKKIHWDAVTKTGRPFKKKYLESNPSLKPRTSGVSTKEELDSLIGNDYNGSQGGLSDGTQRDFSQQSSGRREELGQDNISHDMRPSGDISRETGERISRPEGNVYEGDSRVDRGEDTSNINSSIKQLNGIQSTEDITNGVVKGDIEVKSVADIEQILSKAIETNPEISGKTFEDVANDADNYFSRSLDSDDIDSSAIKEAFLDGDIKFLDQIARKQLAASKLISKLRDSLDVEDTNTSYNILKTMEHLASYTKAIGSGSGGLLNYQKLVNQAMETFGEGKLSDLTKEGIITIADMLEKQVKDIGLSFTRGQKLTPQQYKAQIYSFLESIDDGTFLNSMLEDKKSWEALNKVLDKSYENPSTFKAKDFVGEINKALVSENVEDMSKLLKLCDKTQNIIDVLIKATSKVQSYMINNVLGLKSSIINIVGGATMSMHSANRKIVGGILVSDSSITKSGLRQYQGMKENFSDSLRLAKQAYLKGDGLLSTTKNYIDGAIQYNMEEWNPKSFSDWLSAIPRFMMASDELISQLNYRSMMRSKAIDMVERQLGDMEVSEEVFASMVADKFKSIAFNNDGKPLDVNAFAEAKEILFQTPLNRKMFDYKTGEMLEIGEKSLISKIGETAQSGADKIPFLKFFMPFIKTPFNIADTAVKMNPFVQALSPRNVQRLMSSNPEIAAKARGELAITATISIGAFIAAMDGLITGSEPADRNTASALRKTGWQPYSFYIDGKFISYRTLAPFDTMLAASADTAAIYSAYTEKDSEKKIGFEDALGRAFAVFMNDYADQSGYRGNLEKVMDLLDPSLDVNRKKLLLGQALSGFLPMASNVRNISTIGKHSQTQADNIWKAMVKNYLPTNSDFKRDVFGNRQDMHGLLITNMKDQDFEMPEYQAMAELAQAGWSPSEVSKYVADSKIPFKTFTDPETGRSAYDAMQEELSKITINGLTLRESVRELVTSSDYQALPIGINKDGKDWDSVQKPTKIKEIKAIFKEYNDAAKEEILNGNIPFVNDKGESMRDAVENLHIEMEKNSLDVLTNYY